MNKQLSESETLFKIVRLFIVQYLANVRNILHKLDNYKSVQNQAINILTTHVMKLLKKIIVQIKQLLLMQGRIQPNCLHLLVAIKHLQLFDLDKFLAFIVDKRSKSINFPSIFFEKTISKVFENDYESVNKYQKEKDLPTIKLIKNLYLFNFQDQNQCLPFKCGVDEAFNKPAEFTYKSTIQKIEKQKKNVQNLVAFTRRQNRKALGLYLDSMKQDQKLRKKTKYNQEDQVSPNKKIQTNFQTTKQFDFIGFL